MEVARFTRNSFSEISTITASRHPHDTPAHTVRYNCFCYSCCCTFAHPVPSPPRFPSLHNHPNDRTRTIPQRHINNPNEPRPLCKPARCQKTGARSHERRVGAWPCSPVASRTTSAPSRSCGCLSYSGIPRERLLWPLLETRRRALFSGMYFSKTKFLSFLLPRFAFFFVGQSVLRSCSLERLLLYLRA